jgi:hypothetical protein
MSMLLFGRTSHSLMSNCARTQSHQNNSSRRSNFFEGYLENESNDLQQRTFISISNACCVVDRYPKPIQKRQ